MHRAAHLLGAAALVALVAACGNTVEPVTGAAAPTGTSSTNAEVGSSPAAEPTSPAPTNAPASAPTVLTIAADHIGQLKIGMSLASGKATGLIVLNAQQTSDSSAGCVDAHWKGQTDTFMTFNGQYGLRAVQSYGGQQTPAGITVGSSLAALKKAYPKLTWREDDPDTPDAQKTGGSAFADPVAGDGAHYRFEVVKSKVDQIMVESDRSGCYE